jgi:hypothetical protein
MRQGLFSMTHAERLKRWKAELKRLGINPREAAERLGLKNKQTAYNWNCGASKVPERRILQLEAMK